MPAKSRTRNRVVPERTVMVPDGAPVTHSEGTTTAEEAQWVSPVVAAAMRGETVEMISETVLPEDLEVAGE